MEARTKWMAAAVGAVGVIASVIGIFAFVTGQQSLPAMLQADAVPAARADSSGVASAYRHGLPPAPPENGQAFQVDMELGMESGCYAEGNEHTLTLIEAGQQDIYDSEGDPVYFLQGEDGVRLRFYLPMHEMPNVELAKVPYTMVPGRRLKVRYAQCGNGGIRYLTEVRPAPASG